MDCCMQLSSNPGWVFDQLIPMYRSCPPDGYVKVDGLAVDVIGPARPLAGLIELFDLVHATPAPDEWSAEGSCYWKLLTMSGAALLIRASKESRVDVIETYEPIYLERISQQKHGAWMYDNYVRNPSSREWRRS